MLCRLVILACVVATISGCAMCCGTDDYNYAAYGGRWQRHDMAHGRVGSVFSDAGYSVIDDAVAAEDGFEEVAPPDDPDQIVEPPAEEAEPAQPPTAAWTPAELRAALLDALPETAE